MSVYSLHLQSKKTTGPRNTTSTNCTTQSKPGLYSKASYKSASQTRMIHTSQTRRAGKKVIITPNSMTSTNNLQAKGSGGASHHPQSASRPNISRTDNTKAFSRANNNDQGDYEVVADTSPYLINNLNSYVKSSNYY